MKVRLIYRSYKPLHQLYAPLVANPPAGVEYLVPKTRRSLNKLFPIYRKIRFFGPGKKLIRYFEKTFFLKSDKADNPADLYQYINLTAAEIPTKPYLVDIELAASLVSFTGGPERLAGVKAFLEAENCRGVSCFSEAAQRSLQMLLGADYKKVASKTHVVYPALPLVDMKSLKTDNRYITKDSKKLKLLFVGNQAYLKGLEELLSALKVFNQKHGSQKIELHIISDDAKPLIDAADIPNAYLYPPGFSKEDIYQQFFLPADIFVMPTKEDTFGMAILDALSCGKPVIATRQFAIPELIDNGKDGWLLELTDSLLDRTAVPTKAEMDAVVKPNLDRKLSGRLLTLLEELAAGRYDLKKFGEHGRRKFSQGGKFSISRRNKHLKAVYDSALKN